MGGVDCTTNARHRVLNVTPHPTIPLVKSPSPCPINTSLCLARPHWPRWTKRDQSADPCEKPNQNSTYASLLAHTQLIPTSRSLLSIITITNHLTRRLYFTARKILQVYKYEVTLQIISNRWSCAHTSHEGQEFHNGKINYTFPIPLILLLFTTDTIANSPDIV